MRFLSTPSEEERTQIWQVRFLSTLSEEERSQRWQVRFLSTLSEADRDQLCARLGYQEARKSTVIVQARALLAKKIIITRAQFSTTAASSSDSYRCWKRCPT